LESKIHLFQSKINYIHKRGELTCRSAICLKKLLRYGKKFIMDLEMLAIRKKEQLKRHGVLLKGAIKKLEING